MESTSTFKRPGRGLVIKLGLLAGLGLFGAVVVLQGIDLRELIEVFLERVRAAGPGVFFGTMAVLPALGFPLSPYTLSAGPVFGPVLGVGWVMVAAFAAVFSNVMLGYSLARWVMHPPLERLVVKLGYKLPRIPEDQYWNWTILLRVTPGTPFFMQSVLLGLARVPVKIYLITSLSVAWIYTAGFIYFGDALIHGEGRKAFFGFIALVILISAVQVVRKQMARKRVAALLPTE